MPVQPQQQYHTRINFLLFRDKIREVIEKYPDPVFYTVVGITTATARLKWRGAMKGQILYKHDPDIDNLRLAEIHNQSTIRVVDDRTVVCQPRVLEFQSGEKRLELEQTLTTLESSDLHALFHLLSREVIQGPLRFSSTPYALITETANSYPTLIVEQQSGEIIVL